MEIEFNGYVGLPDLTQVSNLEGLKNLYFPSSLTSEMAENLSYRETEDVFQKNSVIELNKYIKANGLENFEDNIYEKVLAAGVHSLMTQDEKAVKGIQFKEYYEDNIIAGYDFYITIDVDIDKIAEQVKEEAKEDEIDLENGR